MNYTTNHDATKDNSKIESKIKVKSTIVKWDFLWRTCLTVRKKKPSARVGKIIPLAYNLKQTWINNYAILNYY